MKDLKYTEMEIVKKIRADEITWAHGEPTFFFNVKGTDLLEKNISTSEW